MPEKKWDWKRRIKELWRNVQSSRHSSFFHWDISLTDYLTNVFIGSVWKPQNLASLEKRKKQRFNGFCHSPFQLFHVKQFLEKRKQNVSRETFLGWIKGVRKRETAPAAKAVPVRGKLLPSLRGERGSFNPSISAALIWRKKSKTRTTSLCSRNLFVF